LNVNPHHEHEFEAAPGLPEPLPANERILWQGAPQWRLVAVHVFHVRTLAWYFAAMMLLQATYLLGEPERNLFKPLLLSFLLSVISLGILSLMAWLTARTALYTLTNKRVVMRIGIVLTLTFNLPFKRIAAASLKPYKKGTGDIALALNPEDRIGWAHLWPHQRAWHISQPQPTLRCVPNGQQVGEQLLNLWRAERAGDSLRMADASSAPATQASHQQSMLA